MTVVENENCSAAIILIVTTLESYVNRIVYFGAPKGITKTNPPLGEKLKSLLRRKKRLASQVTELTACRDAIVHAYIWEGVAHRTGRRSHFKLATVTDATRKIKTVLRGTRSRSLQFNLVPMNVGMDDVVKGLIVALRLMRALGSRRGAIEGLVPPETAIALRRAGAPADRFDDWIEYLMRTLHERHRQNIVRRFHLHPVRVDGATAYHGIAPD
jgi:hypothetical protein